MHLTDIEACPINNHKKIAHIITVSNSRGAITDLLDLLNDVFTS